MHQPYGQATYNWTDGHQARQPEPCPECVRRARQIAQLRQHRELAMIGGAALVILFVLFAMSG